MVSSGENLMAVTLFQKLRHLFLVRVTGGAEHFRPYKSELLVTSIVFLISTLAELIMRPNFYNPLLWAFLIASFIFFISWLFTTDLCHSCIAKEFLKSEFKNPNFAILSVKELTDDQLKKYLKYTEFTPNDWVELLKKEFNVKLISSSQISNDYSAIINPFGESYPEEDLANLKVLKRIKEYIRKGGVFINIAGLAFFYMMDFKREIEGLTGQMATFYMGGYPGGKHIVFKGLINTYKPALVLEPIIGAVSLIDTWLYKNLGISTTKGDPRPLLVYAEDPYFEDLVDDRTEVIEFRSAQRCETADVKLIPILRAKYKYKPTGRTHECYPIAAVKYGMGYLIIVGMTLKRERINDLLLVTKVIKRIIKKLHEKGSLD
jgi:hypothetical protein